jgi:hypothetical protein
MKPKHASHCGMSLASLIFRSLDHIPSCRLSMLLCLPVTGCWVLSRMIILEEKLPPPGPDLAAADDHSHLCGQRRNCLVRSAPEGSIAISMEKLPREAEATGQLPPGPLREATPRPSCRPLWLTVSILCVCGLIGKVYAVTPP